MEEDVLIIACGGAAKNALGLNAKEGEDQWEAYRRAVEDFGHSFKVQSNSFSTTPLGDREKLKEDMRGIRIVVPFVILGGDLGTDTVKDVIEDAREMGCKVVSVFGIPMEFESDRRQRALETLPEVTVISDCSLVLDMEKSFIVNKEYNQDKIWTSFLKMSDNMMKASMKSIIEYMQGPFFSVYKERMYAFVPSTDVLPVNAVMKAWDNLLFDKGKAMDSAVIMVGSNIRSSEIEDIKNGVAMRFGTIPEVVVRSDSDDSKVIVFRAVEPF